MNKTKHIEQRIAELTAEAERRCAQSESRLADARWELDKACVQRDTAPRDDRLQRSVMKWEKKVKELEGEAARDQQMLKNVTQTTKQGDDRK
jgi:hypothetical protein